MTTVRNRANIGSWVHLVRPMAVSGSCSSKTVGSAANMCCNKFNHRIFKKIQANERLTNSTNRICTQRNRVNRTLRSCLYNKHI